MKIGNLVLDNNIFLAPMAGITDMPFRILCVEQGCGLVYTEMISAKGMYYNDENTGLLTRIHESEQPVALQIFGSDPYIMASITEKLNSSNASIIDINMGCPAPKVTKNGDGSALMLKPELIKEIITETVKASTKPITIKIRKGWNDKNINAVEIAKIAEDSGAKAITIHGRTREQQYSGKADWEIIKQIKQSVSIPVIGNGDIFTPEDAKRMLETTGCDAIMIGRGSYGNPWIFRNTLEYLKTGALLETPSLDEKISTIIRHLEMMIDHKGEHTGIVEMRKQIAWYIKGIRNSSSIKERVFKMSSKDEIINLLKDFSNQNK